MKITHLSQGDIPKVKEAHEKKMKTFLILWNSKKKKKRNRKWRRKKEEFNLSRVWNERQGGGNSDSRK